MTGPLAGVRVVDLTAALAGPYSTMILADLGADIIKVEPPGGEVTRRVGPYPPSDDGQATLGGYFQSINRGKRSIVLDLKTREGHAELLELVRNADVLVENFGPGVVERLDISYDTMRQVNPRLVYGSLTGFGSTWSGESPYMNWPAMDITIQAMAGALSITGTEDGKPVKIGPGIGDIFPGTMLAIGVLSALFEAERTGQGQQIDVAMFDAMLSLCERIVYQYSYTGQVPKPIGNTHPILTPFDVLEVKDGWIAVAATTQLRWEALCRIMERPELIEDARFRNEGCRVEHRAEIRTLLDDWSRDLTRAEVTEKLGGKVPFGPVNDIRDIFDDPHAWARDMLVEIDNPGSSQKAIVAGQPIKFSRTPSKVGTRAPLLDEHGDAIRSESRTHVSEGSR
ncbi:CoA transferase [Rhodococcus opacus]|uniref:CoA transferase n=1 Tax=Rhodococcus opacus TaxID=37919 RepID=A0AAX3YSZ1_RHOOP|nr:CoA transferase [Rhodococcus opacus]MCZ4590291.1 CoA transferase [Rhodococcus opacus]WLF51600.1 CoA transferase [Rhodococcus opacus]WLF52603.1 CoA transferase [Rhodococcus opacus]